MSEKFHPFSKSPLWELQRRYFSEAGVAAWSSGEVPHYVTSNPQMAAAYARFLFAFMLEFQSKYPNASNFYIVELGTGSGRFSYHMLKALQKLTENHLGKAPDFVYVMTDFVAENLHFWEEHPRFQPYFDAGKLDYASFDAEHDEEIYLRKSRKHLGPGDVKQPLLVIANYFFDSLSHELFHFSNGVIQHCLLKLNNYDASAGLEAGEALKQIELEYDYKSVKKPPFSDRTYLDILKIYQQNLDNSHVLFPVVGMTCIERLKKISEHGLLLLTADKAYHAIEDLDFLRAPTLSKHGSFSLTTNYHALKMHCQLSGGVALFPNRLSHHLPVGCLLYVEQAEDYKHSIRHFGVNFNEFSPDDFFTIKKHIEQQIDQLSIRDLFSYLRLSGYDARLFQQVAGRFQDLIKRFSENERFALLQLVANVWDGYFPIAETADLAFQIAILLFNLHFFEEAISFIELSEKIYGKTEKSMYVKALCFHSMNETELSEQQMNELLAHYPDSEIANEYLSVKQTEEKHG